MKMFAMQLLALVGGVSVVAAVFFPLADWITRRRRKSERTFVLDLATASPSSAIVKLGGRDITRLVSGVTVEARGGALARVTLDMNPRGLAVRLDGAVVDAIDHPMWLEKSGAPDRSGPERGRGAAAEP